MTSFTRLLGLLGATVLAVFYQSVFAQPYPNKPIEWVIPYPAGGGTDTVARTLAKVMSEDLGQPLIISNRPGAATNIGADYVAKAKNDGYVIMSADTGTLAANPFLYHHLSFNVRKDFTSIGLTVRFPLILVTNPQVPAHDLKELLAWIKRQPDAVPYATPGAGTPHHLASELFREITHVKLNHIPYKGAAPAVQDVVGGQVPLMFVDSAAGYQFITAGQLRPIGVASLVRVKGFEQIPTLSEQGLSDFEAFAWQGLIAPAGIPTDAVSKLNKALRIAIKSDVVQTQIKLLGIEATPSSPEEMNVFAAKERAKWGSVIQKAGITAD